MKEGKRRKEHLAIYSTTLSQTALLCLMGMIHSFILNAKENSDLK